MEIRECGDYRTRGGEKVNIDQRTEHALFCWSGLIGEQRGFWLDDGSWKFGCESLFDLVAEWGAPIPTPDPDPRDAEIQQLRAALGEAREAFDDILYPMRKIEREARAEGRDLNVPMALQIAADPEFLKGIARAARATIDAALTTTEGPRDV